MVNLEEDADEEVSLVYNPVAVIYANSGDCNRMAGMDGLLVGGGSGKSDRRVYILLGGQVDIFRKERG